VDAAKALLLWACEGNDALDKLTVELESLAQANPDSQLVSKLLYLAWDAQVEFTLAQAKTE